MNAQLRPGEDLKQLVKGAKAARQGDEGLALLDHEQLAFVHGLDHEHIGEVRVLELASIEEVRDDAGDLTTCGQGGIGHGTHHAHAAAAIHKADTTLREGLTDPHGGLNELGVITGARATINGDGVERDGFCH